MGKWGAAPPQHSSTFQESRKARVWATSSISSFFPAHHHSWLGLSCHISEFLIASNWNRFCITYAKENLLEKFGSLQPMRSWRINPEGAPGLACRIQILEERYPLSTSVARRASVSLQQADASNFTQTNTEPSGLGDGSKWVSLNKI